MANDLLKGKRGIVFGALNEESIAWRAALRIREEGASLVLSNAPLALRMGKIHTLAEQCKAVVMPADVTSISDIERVLSASVEALGGPLDFLLHSVGMSPNVRKRRSYGDLDYNWFAQTLDISALSFHKILQTAEKLDAIRQGGSVVALSYVAAQRTFPGYSDMAEAKAVLESIARSYGYRLGRQKQIRVNTISQSPTRTTAAKGIGSFDKFYEYAQKMSPLGNADADACANYIVLMFSDLSRMVTMQNLMHDGGFSSTGVTEEALTALSS